MNLLTLTPIVERLADQARCPSLRKVGTAADLAAAAEAQTAASPAAFVMLLGADADQIEEGSGPFRQSLDVTVAVLLVVNTSGAQGAAGLAKLEAPAGEVRRALFGWQHPGAELKFGSAGEGLEDFDAKTGRTAYRLDFITRTRLLEIPS